MAWVRGYTASYFTLVVEDCFAKNLNPRKQVDHGLPKWPLPPVDMITIYMEWTLTIDAFTIEV